MKKLLVVLIIAGVILGVIVWLKQRHAAHKEVV